MTKSNCCQNKVLTPYPNLPPKDSKTNAFSNGDLMALKELVHREMDRVSTEAVTYVGLKNRGKVMDLELELANLEILYDKLMNRIM